MKIDSFDKSNFLNDSSKLSVLNQKTNNTSFSELFSKSLDEVNKLLVESQDWNEKLALGQVENIHQVVIASQKAELAMQFTMQIRNKILDAYNEIMRMTV